MKTLTQTALVLLVLGTCVQAEIVIDDFSGAPQTAIAGTPTVRALDDDVTGNRTVTATGAISVTTGGNGFSLSSFNAGAVATLVYDLVAPVNLSVPGVDSILELDLFDAVTGAYDLVVTLENTAAATTAFGAVNVNSAGAVSLDAAGLGNAAVTSDVSRITLGFTQTSAGVSTLINNTGARIAAVPEPASLALLGLTGLGGLFVVRRRRQQQLSA